MTAGRLPDFEAPPFVESRFVQPVTLDHDLRNCPLFHGTNRFDQFHRGLHMVEVPGDRGGLRYVLAEDPWPFPAAPTVVLDSSHLDIGVLSWQPPWWRPFARRKAARLLREILTEMGAALRVERDG